MGALGAHHVLLASSAAETFPYIPWSPGVLHVDLDARRSAPFPQALQARIDAVKAAHAELPTPEMAGARIALRRGRQ